MKWFVLLALAGCCSPAYQSQLVVVTPYENGQSTVDLHARLGTIDSKSTEALQELLKRYGLKAAEVKVTDVK